jgi:hypothetical protein
MLCFGKNLMRISITKLFAVRLATETLQVSLPGGAVYAEFIRPYLIKKHFNIDYLECITANIIAKINILLAQVFFLMLGILVLLFSYKDNLSCLDFPEYIFYGGLVIFVSMPFLLTFLIYRRNFLLKLFHLLEKISLRPVKNFVEKIRKPANDISNAISIFSLNHKKRFCLTIAFFLLSWFLMSAESLFILKIIGIDARIPQVILIESFISFVRIIFFFIPGALGPQDAAIILLFNLSGLPDPAVSAFLFVLLKRSKEIFWIITGYILLIYLGVKPVKVIRHKQADFMTVR